MTRQKNKATRNEQAQQELDNVRGFAERQMQRVRHWIGLGHRRMFGPIAARSPEDVHLIAVLTEIVNEQQTQRLELNAMVSLLMQTNKFTPHQFCGAIANACESYDQLMRTVYPGFGTDLEGMKIDPTLAGMTSQSWVGGPLTPIETGMAVPVLTDVVTKYPDIVPVYCDSSGLSEGESPGLHQPIDQLPLDGYSAEVDNIVRESLDEFGLDEKDAATAMNYTARALLQQQPAHAEVINL